MVAVGVNVLNFGRADSATAVRESIVRAESAGFDLAMVSDHVAVTADVDRAYPAPFLEAFTLLGWAAGATSTITLGTTVAVLPYRHPLLVAAMTDTLGQLSDDRFVLGVGVGWSRQEYDALGVDFDRRGAITDDFLAALIAQRDGLDHSGPHVRFEGVGSGRFTAPIWVGGNSKRAIERAVRFGQAWHPLDVTLGWLRDIGVPALRAESAAAPALAPRVKLRPTDDTVDPVRRRLGEGSWDQIEEDFAALVELGATHVVLDPDTAATRAGADPWPWLERALAALREAQR